MHGLFKRSPVSCVVSVKKPIDVAYCWNARASTNDIYHAAVAPASSIQSLSERGGCYKSDVAQHCGVSHRPPTTRAHGWASSMQWGISIESLSTMGLVLRRPSLEKARSLYHRCCQAGVEWRRSPDVRSRGHRTRLTAGRLFFLSRDIRG